MSKTLFGKLMYTNITIVFITIILTGSLLFGFVSNYIIEEKETMLAENGRRIARMTAYTKENGRMFDAYYTMNIDILSSGIGAFIIVTDKSGNVIASTGNQLTGRLDISLLADIMENKEVTIRNSDFNNIFSKPVFTSGVPIVSNGSVIGAVFTSIANPDMNKFSNYVLYTFIMIGILAILLASAIVYVVSRRITKPIKELNKVAKQISSGDFQARISYNEENEIGELASTFNEMAKSLERLETMRSSFVANVSHELRTPMTTISGFVQGILDGTVPPDKQNTYLTIVLEEAKRLSKLVNNILDLAKAEGSDTLLEPSKFSITELLRISTIKLENRIKEKNISVYVNFGNENMNVYADKDSISQVVTNLLDNAVKFTGQNGRIEIDAKTGGAKVTVSIMNSGDGIAPQDLPLIWDRFYKTDKSRSVDKSGAGLGLFIVKSLIQKHGESIWAESEQGKNTTFFFTLKSAEN